MPAIGISLISFIAFDLLYIQVITRYAYYCDFVMNYLISVISKQPEQVTNQEVTVSKTESEQATNQEMTVLKTESEPLQATNQEVTVVTTEPEQTKEQEQKMNVENAFKLLRWLNKSTFTTEIVIVIAGFTAINCTISLLNTKDCPVYSNSSNQKDHFQINKKQTFQVVVITLRLILWTLLALFPFYKAAKVNEIFCQLSFKLTMHSHTFANLKYAQYLSLEARLIGISVQPWIPRATVFLLIFAIMLGSNIKWHYNVL